MSWPITKRQMHVFHGEVFHVDPLWKDKLVTISLSPGEDWTTLSSDHVISKSYNTTASYLFQLDNKQHVYFKRYVYIKPRLKHWLQPSKAAVELAGLYELAQLGITTAQPLAYGEKRSFGILRATFIVTLGIPHTSQLDRFLLDEWRYMPITEKRSQLAAIKSILLNQLAIAHKAGFFHRDLKLRNILIQKTENDFKLIWIDCPRSHWRKSFDFNATVEDFSAMARIGIHVLTRGEQMRFLLDYCGNDRVKARKYWMAIRRRLIKHPPRPAWQFKPSND